MGKEEEISKTLGDSCKNCSLRKFNTYVSPQLNKDAKVLFVGEAPGKNEIKEGIPFVGWAGKMLRRVIDKLGIPYSITNTVKCRPSDSEGNNRSPTLEEVRCCFDKVVSEVSQYNFIVLLGEVAIKAFFPNVDKIFDVAGEIKEKNGKRFLCVYHPSRMRYVSPAIRAQWIRDLSKVKDMVEGDMLNKAEC